MAVNISKKDKKCYMQVCFGKRIKINIFLTTLAKKSEVLSIEKSKKKIIGC